MIKGKEILIHNDNYRIASIAKHQPPNKYSENGVQSTQNLNILSNY